MGDGTETARKRERERTTAELTKKNDVFKSRRKKRTNESVMK